MHTDATTDFVQRAQRLGGEGAYALYALTVSDPASKTWYLAATDLDADALYTDSPAYQGLVLDPAPLASSEFLGGAVTGGRLTLTLSDHLGSARGLGRFRRFSDWFAMDVAGETEPYDLDTAVLVVSLTWDGLTSADVLTLERLVVVPGSKRLTPGRLSLEFGPDPRFHRPLPQRKITPPLWPNATLSISRAIPLVFGAGVSVPGLLVDASLGRYIFCESPTATPVTISAIKYLSPDPQSGIPEYVTLTSASNPIYSHDVSAGSALALSDGDPGATSPGSYGAGLYLSANYLVTSVEIELSCMTAASNLYGRVIVEIFTHGGDWFPGPDLVHPNATASLDASTITADTTFRFYTFTFSTPVLLRASTVYWIKVSYAEGATADTTSARVFDDSAAAPADAGTRIMPYRESQWKLLLVDTTRGTLSLKVNGVAFTTSVALLDGAGQPVAGVTFNQDLADAQIIATLTGMKDDTSGTYTGTASATVQNGADILRFLLLADIALDLDSARVDTTTLTTLRSRLTNWPALAGVLAEDADGWLWLQRVARCARAAVYEEQDGSLTVVTDLTTSPTSVRRVRPWECGPIELGGPAEAAGMPWTLIEVYAGRTLVATAVPDNPEAQRVTEWGVLVRHEASAALVTRYGIRTNAGQIEAQPGRFVSGGPTEGNTFYFVDDETDAKVVLAHLVTLGAAPRDPWGVLRVPLPRFALGWRLTDEFTLESWDFPSALDRARVGEVHWAGATDWDGGTTQWYQARRGRFVVRGLGITAHHGPAQPVLVTAALVGWETP